MKFFNSAPSSLDVPLDAQIDAQQMLYNFQVFFALQPTQLQGKMKAYALFIYIICCIYMYTSIEIKPELKKNNLKFGYGINYKYEGMLAHSFDRFM